MSQPVASKFSTQHEEAVKVVEQLIEAGAPWDEVTKAVRMIPGLSFIMCNHLAMLMCEYPKLLKPQSYGDLVPFVSKAMFFVRDDMVKSFLNQRRTIPMDWFPDCTTTGLLQNKWCAVAHSLVRELQREMNSRPLVYLRAALDFLTMGWRMVSCIPDVPLPASFFMESHTPAPPNVQVAVPTLDPVVVLSNFSHTYATVLLHGPLLQGWLFGKVFRELLIDSQSPSDAEMSAVQGRVNLIFDSSRATPWPYPPGFFTSTYLMNIRPLLPNDAAEAVKMGFTGPCFGNGGEPRDQLARMPRVLEAFSADRPSSPPARRASSSSNDSPRSYSEGAKRRRRYARRCHSPTPPRWRSPTPPRK